MFKRSLRGWIARADVERRRERVIADIRRVMARAAGALNDVMPPARAPLRSTSSLMPFTPVMVMGFELNNA